MPSRSKFKVDDRVMFVGYCSWNDFIRKDIGLTGEVVRVEKYYVRVNLSNSNSGNDFWNVMDDNGIELLEGQMLFDFMYDSK